MPIKQISVSVCRIFGAMDACSKQCSKVIEANGNSFDSPLLVTPRLVKSKKRTSNPKHLGNLRLAPLIVIASASTHALPFLQNGQRTNQPSNMANHYAQ